jgi:hypothetical protein
MNKEQISLESAAALQSLHDLRFVKADHLASRPFVPPEDSICYSLAEIRSDHK